MFLWHFKSNGSEGSVDSISWKVPGKAKADHSSFPSSAGPFTCSEVIWALGAMWSLQGAARNTTATTEHSLVFLFGLLMDSGDKVIFLFPCSFSLRFDTVDIQGMAACDCAYVKWLVLAGGRWQTVRDTTAIILRLGEHAAAGTALKMGICTPFTDSCMIGSAGRVTCFSSYSTHPIIWSHFQSTKALSDFLRWFFHAGCLPQADFFEGKIHPDWFGQLLAASARGRGRRICFTPHQAFLVTFSLNSSSTPLLWSRDLKFGKRDRCCVRDLLFVFHKQICSAWSSFKSWRTVKELELACGHQPAYLPCRGGHLTGWWAKVLVAISGSCGSV